MTFNASRTVGLCNMLLISRQSDKDVENVRHAEADLYLEIFSNYGVARCPELYVAN